MIELGRHNVLGVLVNAVDYEAVVTCTVTAALGRQKLAVSAVAVHGIMTGLFDAQQKYRLNCLDIFVPDGHPVPWALNRLHTIHLPAPLYRPRLMLAICHDAPPLVP